MENQKALWGVDFSRKKKNTGEDDFQPLNSLWRISCLVLLLGTSIVIWQFQRNKISFQFLNTVIKEDTWSEESCVNPNLELAVLAETFLVGHKPFECWLGLENLDNSNSAQDPIKLKNNWSYFSQTLTSLLLYPWHGAVENTSGSHSLSLLCIILI